jgi:propanediol dehydratase small subunit
VAFDPSSDYPLGQKRPELVATPGGRGLDDMTLAQARSGALSAAEMRATPGTLRLQAEVARAGGREQLARNLERAAELASVPDELLLEVYTALRPRRATARELDAWAERLEQHDATATAAFVREAAEVYAERGLLADGA